ncbi:alpha/beta fold hydrolase [Acuticoccus sp. MNP-M23]|uniref:alpha/beta fold hydrolase n=1 Tax=Acuticoccus sp. MNP-M23 TaxID=3072793 RepID=UPI002814C896|nr:alpha/beta fold hydrolase [Acuticoccus sp. MNP-M23]WMS42494.1 alpha/beta fold hydrolase [Acuticoccus sp. MNP-M23]
MAFDHVGARPRIAIEWQGSGPLVVFLHGIGGNRTNWRGNLPAVAEKFTALGWDARGYGESDDYDGPFRFADAVADLAAVLDRMDAATAHLVGLSLGGRIAAHFHAAHPARVASLTLCDTHLGFGHYPEKVRKRFVQSRRDPLLAGATMDELAPAIARTLIGDPTDAETLGLLTASMGAVRRESYIKTVTGSVEDDMTPKLDNVRVPALVLTGQHDRITPPSMAREIAARIPGSTVAVLDGAGHLSNVERPDAFNRTIMAFLEAVER